MRGYVLAGRGETTPGLALARKGWADWTATGSRYHATYYLALLAQTCERAGQVDEALDLDVHRRDAQRQAEACFHRALTVAREQHARLWELRAATSLARYWEQQGKRTDALDLLTPVQSRFPEGLNTPDATDAKTLLDDICEGPGRGLRPDDPQQRTD